MSNTVELKHCPKCSAPISPGAPQGLCPKCVLLGAAAATETGVPATATSEIPSLQRVAAAFPQLEIVELIGRGGMGFVFKARQPHLDRWVALKLLPDKLARDPRFTERFNREGRVLARLNHPNIVSVYDFGVTEHFYFLLMEFVDGVNLRQAMQAGRFSPGEALSIVPKICEALQYAHEQGILHRDIKPENILLDTRGHLKIADFGIAKLVGEEKPDVALTATGAALGTPHYMAPEQLEKPFEVDHRADIYSLGVVFYEMLTGELPIGRFAAPSTKTPVGANVDEVVFRTLEKDRERRFQSAGEMKTEVEHLGQGEPAEVPSTASSSRFSQWAFWGAIMVGLSLVAPLSSLVAILGGHGGIGRVELGLALASIALPGLGGTLLGWLGLNEIRESGGRVRGLPLAIFATLTWPLLILGGLAIGLPMFSAVPPSEPTIGKTLGRMLVLLVPASVITFGIWAIYTTARWASRQPVAQRRGVLKWVFIALLLAGMGMVMVTRSARGPDARTPAQPVAVSMEPASIRFTFTAIELREMGGARWLAIDYVDNMQGECEKSFPWETTIPGFRAETRATEFLSDAKTSPPARHQRLEYRMPDAVPRDQLERFRGEVEKALHYKSFRLEPGEQKLLFELVTAKDTSLKAWVKVGLPLSEKARVQAEPANVNRTQPSQFVAAVEKVLPEPAVGVACLLDFETGQLITPPDVLAERLKKGMADIGEEAVDWLRESGADAVVNMPNAGVLRLFEGAALSMAHDRNPPLRWEQFTPSEVVAALGEASWERSHRFQKSDRTFYATPALSPDALAFITREGSMGVMEILGLNANPRGVKIRYKLVQAVKQP